MSLLVGHSKLAVQYDWPAWVLLQQCTVWL